MFFFEDLLKLISVTAPTFQWVISALNALAKSNTARRVKMIIKKVLEEVH